MKKQENVDICKLPLDDIKKLHEYTTSLIKEAENRPIKAEVSKISKISKKDIGYIRTTWKYIQQRIKIVEGREFPQSITLIGCVKIRSKWTSFGFKSYPSFYDKDTANDVKEIRKEIKKLARFTIKLSRKYDKNIEKFYQDYKLVSLMRFLGSKIYA